MNARATPKAQQRTATDDVLEAVSARVFGAMALLMGAASILGISLNLVRGYLSGLEFAIGLALTTAGLGSALAVVLFPRVRKIIMAAACVVTFGGLVGVSLHFMVMPSTTTVFMLILIVGLTLLAGSWVGGLAAGATVATFTWIYVSAYAEAPPIKSGGDIVDWDLITIAMSTAAAVLYVIAAFYRQQMLSTARELGEARDRAEELGRAKSDFLANMSHEIRTPMNGVLGMIDVCLNGEIGEEGRRQLEVARGSANTLIRILSDVLDFSKLESGNLEIEPVPTDIRKLIGNTAVLFSSTAREKNIALNIEGIDSLPALVMIDPDRVSQIIANLLSNAVKFTDKGSVVLSATYDDHVLRLAVADTGCGMPDAFLPEAFSRFRQADRHLSDRKGGTGLGLAISRDLCRLMGGDIYVTSEVGRGSCFDLWLPAREVSRASEATSTDVSRPPAAPAIPEASRHILVVEDNAVNRAVAEAFLRRLGHRASVAFDGVEAVDAVKTADFDLILMDLSMPRLDGIGATRQIRALGGAASETPILMLTAHVEQSLIERCFEAGADDVLHKPLNVHALNQCIAELTAAAQAGDEDVSEAV